MAATTSMLSLPKDGIVWWCYEGGDSVEILQRGWSQPEQAGIWSDGDAAGLTFSRPLVGDTPLLISLSAVGYVVGADSWQLVKVSSCGVPLAELLLSEGSFQTTWFVAPRAFAEVGLSNLLFSFPRALRPSEAEGSPDSRKLAMMLKSVAVRPLPAEPYISIDMPLESWSCMPLPGEEGIVRLTGRGSRPRKAISAGPSCCGGYPIQRSEDLWEAWIHMPARDAEQALTMIRLPALQGGKGWELLTRIDYWPLVGTVSANTPLTETGFEIVMDAP